MASLVSSPHPAKYASGVPTACAGLAQTDSLGDPFAGSGRLAEELQRAVALNDLDPRWAPRLEHLRRQFGCEISAVDAAKLSFRREAFIFSPPYYPRTDRRRLAAHDDVKRGGVVGYRSGYGCSAPGFIGDPSGVRGIAIYRAQMSRVYAHLRSLAARIVVVVKNQTRLGTELRLDWDTIQMAQGAGWHLVKRTGWRPLPSLWQRYNIERGTAVEIEDVLVFDS